MESLAVIYLFQTFDTENSLQVSYSAAVCYRAGLVDLTPFSRTVRFFRNIIHIKLCKIVSFDQKILNRLGVNRLV